MSIFDPNEVTIAANGNGAMASGQTAEALLEAFRDLNRKFAALPKPPTAYVMTRAVWGKVLESANKHESAARPQNRDAISPFGLSLMGVPVEVYPTFRQCLDRMVESKPGERLCLVDCGEIAETQYKDHPYWKVIAKQMEQRLADGERIEVNRFAKFDEPVFKMRPF